MKSLWNDCDDHLYIFESSCGHIKIGRTTDVEQRLRNLQGVCPPSVSLSILAVAENHGDWEHGLHELLDQFRIRNEWFSAAAAEWLRPYLAQAGLAIVVRKLARRITNRREWKRKCGTAER